MIGRSLELAEELGLSDRVRAEQTDLNTWIADERADIYFAVHSVHHVVELEHLYDEVAGAIDPEGVLLVNDMIGRKPRALARGRRDRPPHLAGRSRALPLQPFRQDDRRRVP
jgi:hypothetical protein